MKYPHTGLFHFCLNLGRSLQKVTEGSRELCFYTPPSALGLFGQSACYIKQHSLHKLWLPYTGDADIWHNTYQSSNYIPKKRKLKILLTIHDLNFMYDGRKTEQKKISYLTEVKKNIQRADHIVFISEFVKADVEDRIGIFGKPSTVIYNGCNIHEIPSLQTPQGFTEKEFLFTIGTIAEKKNFHVIPCLLANNDLYLVVAGITQEESYKNRIIEEAIKWNVEDRLVFTGPISENDKQWYYQNCTAFIFPSLSEGFGLPVVEAMYFGKPVLLSTCTSLPEIGGQEAYYFESFNSEQMQSTFAYAIADYKSGKKTESIKSRSALFSWEKAALQYNKVYDQLLQT